MPVCRSLPTDDPLVQRRKLSAHTGWGGGGGGGRGKQSAHQATVARLDECDQPAVISLIVPSCCAAAEH